MEIAQALDTLSSIINSGINQLLQVFSNRASASSVLSDFRAFS
jgi:hypothetical protein